MLGHYFTIALRSLRRAPLTAAVNVVALALGLAAFVTAYGVVAFWDKSERHFANVDRTYVITANLEARNGSLKTGVQPTTNRLYADYLKTEFPDFEAVARTQTMSNEAGVSTGDVSERMFTVAADPAFLDMFDLPFVAGDAKNALREPNSVVLTQDAARRLFGTDAVLGRTITLGSVLDVRVTGVIGPIPEPSYFGHSAAATVRFDVLASWDTLDGVNNAARARQEAQGTAPPQPPPRPANAPPPPENWLGGYCCMTFVMTKADSALTPAALDAQLREFGNRHLPVVQQDLATLTVGAVPLGGLMVSQLNGQLLGGSGISITTVLLALSALVLIVACVNYASLATAQAARRAREVGMRKAIGANRRRVMFQYLAEAAMLTVIAAAVALFAVRLLTPLLRNSVGINLSVGLYSAGFWLFLAGLLVVVTLLGGAYPAFVLARVPPIEALRIGRSKTGPRFATTLLVGGQFAAASFLLIVVFVMYAQNRELQRTGLGTDADPLLVIPNFSQFSGVDNKLLQEELKRIPQVTGVSETSQSPWSSGVGLAPMGRTPEDSVVQVAAIINTVGLRLLHDARLYASGRPRVRSRARRGHPAAGPAVGQADQRHDRRVARRRARFLAARVGRRAGRLLPERRAARVRRRRATAARDRRGGQQVAAVQRRRREVEPVFHAAGHSIPDRAAVRERRIGRARGDRRALEAAVAEDDERPQVHG